MSAAPDMTVNPYFDPNPTWLFVTLELEGVIGLLTAIFATYLVIWKSPSYNKRSFRYALVYHIFIGILFQLHYSFLTQPLVYLPYMAMELRGIWSALGMDADIQITLLIGLIIMAISVIVPFLYYRMDCIPPPYHPLNSKRLHYCVYFLSYGVSHLVPMPLIITALRYYERNVAKKYFEETYHVYLEGFWKKEVVAVMPHGNPWAIAFLVVLGVVIFLSFTISFGCTVVIYQTVKGNSATVSEQMQRDRRRMLVSLVILMLIVTSVAAVVAPMILYTVFTASLRCDIFNIMVACAGGLYPTFIVVYINSYKPYRDAFLGFLKKMRMHTSSNNATLVIPINKY